MRTLRYIYYTLYSWQAGVREWLWWRLMEDEVEDICDK
jgi:hypothetical protein